MEEDRSLEETLMKSPLSGFEVLEVNDFCQQDAWFDKTQNIDPPETHDFHTAAGTIFSDFPMSGGFNDTQQHLSSAGSPRKTKAETFRPDADTRDPYADRKHQKRAEFPEAPITFGRFLAVGSKEAFAIPKPNPLFSDTTAFPSRVCRNLNDAAICAIPTNTTNHRRNEGTRKRPRQLLDVGRHGQKSTGLLPVPPKVAKVENPRRPNHLDGYLDADSYEHTDAVADFLQTDLPAGLASQLKTSVSAGARPSKPSLTNHVSLDGELEYDPPPAFRSGGRSHPRVDEGGTRGRILFATSRRGRKR